MRIKIKWKYTYIINICIIYIKYICIRHDINKHLVLVSHKTLHEGIFISVNHGNPVGQYAIFLYYNSNKYDFSMAVMWHLAR